MALFSYLPVEFRDGLSHFVTTFPGNFHPSKDYRRAVVDYTALGQENWQSAKMADRHCAYTSWTRRGRMGQGAFVKQAKHGATIHSWQRSKCMQATVNVAFSRALTCKVR
jgi:hypothetical protein